MRRRETVWGTTPCPEHPTDCTFDLPPMDGPSTPNAFLTMSRFRFKEQLSLRKKFLQTLSNLNFKIFQGTTCQNIWSNQHNQLDQAGFGRVMPRPSV